MVDNRRQWVWISVLVLACEAAMSALDGAKIVADWLAANYPDDPCNVLAQGYYPKAKQDLIARIDAALRSIREESD